MLLTLLKNPNLTFESVYLKYLKGIIVFSFYSHRIGQCSFIGKKRAFLKLLNVSSINYSFVLKVSIHLWYVIETELHLHSLFISGTVRPSSGL